MNLQEQPISGEQKFAGHIVNLRVDQARIGDGSLRLREVVEHPGGVSVVALTEKDEVLMVRQFRYAMQEVLLELPAGKLEPGEDPKTAALRELEEECGLTADEVVDLHPIYPSVGYDSEVI